MALHTFADNDALPASDLNSYCSHTGGAFDTWTPAVVQSGSVTTTTTRAVYWRAGRLVHAVFQLAVTGTGAANNVVTISLPVTAANSSSNEFIGDGKIRDATGGPGGDFYGWLVLNSTTTCKLRLSADSLDGLFAGQTSSSFSAALASGDTVAGRITYEAASG